MPLRVNHPITPPTPPAAMTASTIDHTIGSPLEVKIHGSSGMRAPTAKENSDEIAAPHGEPVVEGSTPNSSRACVRSAISGSRMRSLGEPSRQLRVDAAIDEQLAQLFLFLLRGVLDRLALDVDLVLEELLLRAHRDVLAARHREPTGDEPGESGQSNDVVTGIGPGETEDQRGVGDQTVTHPEDRGAIPTPGHVAVFLRGGSFRLIAQSYGPSTSIRLEESIV